MLLNECQETVDFAYSECNRRSHSERESRNSAIEAECMPRPDGSWERSLLRPAGALPSMLLGGDSHAEDRSGPASLCTCNEIDARMTPTCNIYDAC